MLIEKFVKKIIRMVIKLIEIISHYFIILRELKLFLIFKVKKHTDIYLINRNISFCAVRFCIVNSFHTHNTIENVCQNLVQSKNSKVECIIETDRQVFFYLVVN